MITFANDERFELMAEATRLESNLKKMETVENLESAHPHCSFDLFLWPSEKRDLLQFREPESLLLWPQEYVYGVDFESEESSCHLHTHSLR
jgi:hypothetical protein